MAKETAKVEEAAEKVEEAKEELKDAKEEVADAETPAEKEAAKEKVEEAKEEVKAAEIDYERVKQAAKEGMAEALTEYDEKLRQEEEAHETPVVDPPSDESPADKHEEEAPASETGSRWFGGKK